MTKTLKIISIFLTVIFVISTFSTAIPIFAYEYGDVNQGQMPDRIYSVKFNGQEIQNYTFDELGRLQKKTTPTTSGNAFEHIYNYRNYTDSNKTTTQVSDFYNYLGKYTYTYDNVGNISSVAFTSWNESVIPSKTTYYTYDALGQLIDVVDGKDHYAYDYDSSGNITFNGYIYDNNDESFVGKTYTYGDGEWKDQLSSFNGQAIHYDKIGNPVYYKGANLTWSEGRRLASFDNGAYSLTFAYDSSGKRISKTVNGNAYNYIYSGDTVIAITRNDNSNVLSFICDENGDYVGFTYGSGTYYYIRNLQNDVVAIADANKNVLVTYSYDPWGTCTISGKFASTIGDINPIRYRGYFYDSETGFYYLQSRYYDPDTCRFINADEPEILLEDDVSLLQSNLYAYCWNNPVVNKDSSGYWVETALDIAFIVGDVASIVANPANVIGYVELAADVVGLVVPGMTGGGKIVRVVMNSDNLVDATKVVDKIVDSNKAIKSSTELGQKLHKMYDPIKDAASGKLKKLNKTIGDKVRLRPDAVDESNKIIYELKPFNKNSYKKALKQVQKYVDELGGKWNVVLDFYMR